MTAPIKDELAALAIGHPCCQRAEVATLLRLAGEVSVVGGRVVLEASFGSEAVARRLSETITELHGHLPVVTPSRTPGGRHTIHLVKDAEALVRQAGLVNKDGVPVPGLSASLITRKCDVVSIWRAAFLARGSVTATARDTSLEVACPDAPTAGLLRDIANRMHAQATIRQTRGTWRVTIRDAEAIGRLFRILGAHQSYVAWNMRQVSRRDRATTSRSANFSAANAHRSAAAAAETVGRVEGALRILGDEVSGDLRTTGELRVVHPSASLAALGAMHTPGVTKATVARRLGRLVEESERLGASQS